MSRVAALRDAVRAFARMPTLGATEPRRRWGTRSSTKQTWNTCNSLNLYAIRDESVSDSELVAPQGFMLAENKGDMEIYVQNTRINTRKNLILTKNSLIRLPRIFGRHIAHRKGDLSWGRHLED